MDEFLDERRFFKVLAIIAFFWAIGGSLLSLFPGFTLVPFLICFGITLFSLVLLITIVRILLNIQLNGAIKIGQILFFSFFKLVCLVFLAITLKRFKEMSLASMLVGVSFYWVAPALAGVFCLNKK